MSRNSNNIRVARFVFILVLWVVISVRLYADIVITNDDMIFNGKIIEDEKPVFIRLANYHGTFTINYNQIKQIHRTENFNDDIRIIKQMGRDAGAEEIKNNYIAGEDKLYQHKKILESKSGFDKINGEYFILSAGLFCNRNIGELASVLQYSTGLSLSAAVPAKWFGNIYLYGVEIESVYLYSGDSNKNIKGYYMSLGPLWDIPVSTNIAFNFSALAGGGWFSVRNSDAGEKLSSAKWNLALHAGPEIKLGSFRLSPGLRFGYIYDSGAPLMNLGLSIDAGYAF